MRWKVKVSPQTRVEQHEGHDGDDKEQVAQRLASKVLKVMDDRRAKDGKNEGKDIYIGLCFYRPGGD